MSVLNVNTIQPVGSASTVTINALVNSDTSLSFGVNSDEKVRIDSDGKVGINTTNPGYLLDIQKDTDASLLLKCNGTGASDDTVMRFQIGGTTANNYIYFGDSADTNVGVIKYGHNNNSMTFTTNATEKVRIESGGNVGVGTNNPNNKLHVYGGIIKSQSDPADTDTDVVLFTAQSGSSGGGVFSIRAADASDDNTAWDIKTNASEDLKFTIGGSDEVLRISSVGRVYMGHTASVAAGGVNPAVQVQGVNNATSSVSLTRNNNDAVGPYLILSKSRGTQVGSTTIVQNNDACGILRFAAADGTDLNSSVAQIKAEIDGAVGVNSTPGALIFGTTNDDASSVAERMRIDSSGNIGINNTSPAYKLDVAASGTVVSRFKQNTNDTAETAAAILIRHAGARSGQNGYGMLFQNSSGTKAGQIDIGNSTVGYESGSDYRLKENEVSISDAITRLKILKPYKFNFKIDPSITFEGFFAHEAQEVVPYAVSGEKDGEDMQGMDYGKLTPLLTAALQEAIAEIETLKTKVANLESS